VSGGVVRGRIPLTAIVMAIELHIEREKTRQIPLLGIDRALRLAGHLRAKVLLGECC
jgi:hypothetical protein